jgi:hypothetical protein
VLSRERIRLIPFFDEREVKLLRVLTDRGTEYCGNPEHHEYKLYLAVEDVDQGVQATRAQAESNAHRQRDHAERSVLNPVEGL